MPKSTFALIFIGIALSLAGCQSTSDDGGAATQNTARATPQSLDLNGKALFFVANTNFERRDSYSQTDRGSFTETQRGTSKKAVLIRQNDDRLLIADPDTPSGVVFVNGRSVNSSGSIAGKGKTVCVELQIEEGYRRDLCSRYSYRNGIIEITEEEKDPAESRTTKRSYKLSFDGNSCKFVSYTSSSNATDAYCDGICLSAYGGSTKWRYTSKSTATTGSCSIR
ncbi:hypothetical protein [uncultured Roseibium sp.]|uniref:hypothetical protein n=1 Tax=uncultured Roseibium sp. TaxID=1936171 RepID=UPI00262AD87D|nr:hypothetical protein [uncultured Roseibium sp.]